jgi:hypothetical protein
MIVSIVRVPQVGYWHTSNVHGTGSWRCAAITLWRAVGCCWGRAVGGGRAEEERRLCRSSLQPRVPGCSLESTG